MQLVTVVFFFLALFCDSHAFMAGDLVPFRPPRLNDASFRGVALLSKPAGIDGGRIDEVTGDYWKSSPMEQDNQEESVKTVLFGDTECPCIGFDNIDGTITYSYDPDHPESSKIHYPADVGSRCEKWEAGRHPDCMPGGNPGAGRGWCNQAWCFVDPCNCNIPILPQRSVMAQHTMYRGRQIHYSYATCGGKDVFEKVQPKIGHASCQCVGFSNVPWTNDISWTNKSGQTWTMQYPGDMGGTCQAWDEDVHPLCKNAGPGRPDWCDKKWCFVDPCECDLPTPPKVTMVLPWATFTGKSLYYSYETCGNADSYTPVINTEACVNQFEQDNCLRLKIRGVQKCAWTGDRCLGAELVHHPLCAHLAKDILPEYMRKTRQEIAAEHGDSIYVPAHAHRQSSVVVLQLLLFLGLGGALVPASEGER